MPYINESTNRLIFKDADQGGFAGNIARAAQAFANVATALPQLRMQQEDRDRQIARQSRSDYLQDQDRSLAAEDRLRNISRQSEQDRIAAEDRTRNIARQTEQDDMRAAQEFDRRYPSAATWLDMPDALTMSGGRMRSAPAPKAVVDPEDAKLISSVDAFQRHLLDTQAQDPVMGKDATGNDIQRTDEKGMPLYTKRPLTDKERKDRLLQQYDPQSKILSPTIRKYLFDQGNVEYVSKDDRPASPFGADSLPILRNGADGATGGPEGYDPAALRNLELALQDPLAKRRFAPSQLTMLDSRTRPLQQARGQESVGILQGPQSEGFTLPTMSGGSVEAPVEAAPVEAPVEAGEGAASPGGSVPQITSPEQIAAQRADHETKAVQSLVNGIAAAEAALARNAYDEKAHDAYRKLMGSVDLLPPALRQQAVEAINAKRAAPYERPLAPEGSSPLNRQQATIGDGSLAGSRPQADYIRRYVESDPRLRADPLFDIPRM